MKPSRAKLPSRSRPGARSRRWAAMLLALAIPVEGLLAQSEVFTESFKGSTLQNGWYFGGNYTPWLTAGANPNGGAGNLDAVGNGWLRLTDNGANRATYAMLDTEIFSVGAQIQIEMEYAFWNGSGADGITFFLIDGSISAEDFRPGAYGGSLGYAQKIKAEGGEADIAGMTGGYLGFGFDNWGNYSNDNEGRVGGITDDGTLYPNRIAVRGPESSDYAYIAGANLDSYGQMDFPSATTRPGQTGADYRSFRLTLDANNILVVEMKFGASSNWVVAFTADLSSFDRPETLKLGFTGATGGANEIHEIRNLLVTSTPLTYNNYEWDAGAGSTAWDISGATNKNNWVGDNLPSTNGTGDILFRNASPNTAQTVNLTSGTAVRSLNFESTRDHTLTGSTITLGDGVTGNSPSINVAQSGSAIVHHRINNQLTLTETTRISNIGNAVLCLNGIYNTAGNSTFISGNGSVNFNGQITGSGAIVKDGAGITTINGNNTGWSGALTINQGVVAITNNGSLGTTAGVTTVNSGGSLFLRGGTTATPLSTAEPLRLAGTGVTLRGGGQSGALHADGGTGSAFTVSGPITLTGHAAIGGRAGSSLTASGVISGAYNLTKVGDGLVVFGANNTYTGATIIEGGALRVSATNQIDNSNLQLNGGVLEIANGFGTFNRGLGAGGSAVQWTGDGGFSAFGANATVNLGSSLTWGTGGFVGAGNALLLSSDYATHTLDFQNAIALAGTSSTLREIRVANGSAAVDGVLSGNISGNAGILKTGDGTLSLAGGTKNYSGATEIRAGALRGATSASSNIRLTGGVRELAAGYTASLGTGGGQIQWLSGGGGLAADTANRTFNVGGNAQELTWGGASGNSQYFVRSGDELVLGSRSTAATLTFANAINLNNAERTIRVIDGVANSATPEAIISGAIGSTTPASGALKVTGNGRLDLTAANTFTGALTVIGAEVRLGGSGGAHGTLTGGPSGAGVTSITVRQGGAFSIDNTSSANNTVNRVRDDAAISLQGGSLNLYGRAGGHNTTETVGTVTLSSGANTINVARGDANGSAQLTLSGLTRTAGATVNFTAVNTTGGSGGALGSAGNNPRIVGSANGTIANTNGILGGWATVGDYWAYEINDTQGIGARTTGYEESTSPGDWGSTENISIAGNATNNNSRTINSFRLDGTAAGRTLDLDNSGTNRTLTIASGGILSVGANTNIIRADNAGSVLRAGTGSSDLIIHTQGTGNTLNISPRITDGASSAVKGLTKAGDGTLIFSGATSNTYTGTTTVNAGTLVLDKTAGVNAIAGNLVIGDGRGTDTVVIKSSEQIANNRDVTLRGGEVGNSDNVARLVFDDSAGSITESFSRLHIEGNTVLDFSGGNPCSPTFLILDVLTGAADSLLTIVNWIEFTDYLLVKKDVFDASDRPRIVFDGYPGTYSWQSYDSTYYQITPVPEPAAYGVLALGSLGGFALWRRRRVRPAGGLAAR